MGKFPAKTKSKKSNKKEPEKHVISGKIKKTKKNSVTATNGKPVETKIKTSPKKKTENKSTGKKSKSTLHINEEIQVGVANAPAAASEAGSEEAEKKVRYDSKPENTIFIGNLPTNTKKNQLSHLFEQFGKVVSIRFRTCDGKKLFKHQIRKKAESLNAYLVFDNTESKQQALSLCGTEFKGHHIRVTAAKDFTTDVEPKRTIFIGNLKYSATDEKLYEIFSTCGDVDYVRTVRNNKGCTGVAYVCFKKSEAVNLALELNNTILDERPIRVQRYKKTPKKVQDSQKALTSPVRRLLQKKKLGKKGKVENKSDKGGLSKEKLLSPKKEKKSDYRGKKTTTLKKKAKNKRKPTHLQKIAKKIAPK